MTSGSPLRRRDFRLLLFGQTTTQLGTQVSGVAIPLLAVVTLDASPLQLGLVTAAGTIAFALIGLPAGVWIDRWRRRPVLVAADLARAVLLATIPLAALLGTLTIAQLVVVSLLAGLARVFFDVGYQSYLPSVVGRGELIAGNSAMESIRACGQVAGPGVGGWAVTVLGSANVVLVQAVTFAVSAASLLAIRAPEPSPNPRPGSGVPGAGRGAETADSGAGRRSRGLVAEIGEGLAFVTGSRVLRATTITSAAGNLAFAIASAASFPFMIHTLGLTPTGIGLVLAAGSPAALAGAALTPRLARRIGSARVIWLSLAVTGPVAMLSPLAGPGWGVGLFVFGTAVGELGQIVYAVTNVSLRQRLCPEHMLGRVNATVRWLMMGLFPLGALLGGILGEAAGPRPALWAAAVVIVLSPLPAYAALRGIREAGDVPLVTSP
ncbi:MFS transporter [Nonomuraea gerenzanensis]|uniref:Major facilitator superfamily MFS_1 n=1 Tax=Nonomuraea gerenzanensis TaxID=93944 RepID=A0A1M4E7C0_9ACTN|nr:MFS transporter [Nonomuraea gerenzanensis]UBU16920.1 MFS transporter [Nonomuraea gerenzanensis]SBO94638.1 major facilitator superfamily MFS_1 [Nonomuraea gerenzanensis]